jgi:hypothetical protein
MAIDPTVITTQNVGSLPTSAINLTDKFPHEVSGYLKQSSVNDLAVFIAAYVGAASALVFNTTKVTTGQTLPATSIKEFLFIGAGTFPNVGGGAAITTTQGLNVLTSNGSFWTLSVEVPVTVTFNGLVQTIRQGFTGTVTSEGALFTALELIKADVIKSAPFLGAITPTSTPSQTDNAYWLATQNGTYTNHGGVVVGTNSFAIISVKAGVYSISQTALDLTSYQKKSDIATTVLASNTTNSVTGNAVLNTIEDKIQSFANPTNNIINYRNFESGIYINNNGVITKTASNNWICIKLNGDFVSGTNYFLQGYSEAIGSSNEIVIFADANNNFISSVLKSAFTGGFAIPNSSVKNIYIRIANVTNIGLTPTVNAFTSTMQLKKGTASTSFEQYGYKLTLPTPSAEIISKDYTKYSSDGGVLDLFEQISTLSYNILNPLTFEGKLYVINGSNKVVSSLSSNWASVKLQVSPSTQYFLQGFSSMSAATKIVIFGTSTDDFISSVDYSVFSGGFTTPSNCTYVYLALANVVGVGDNPTTNAAIQNIQLTAGILSRPFIKYGKYTITEQDSNPNYFVQLTPITATYSGTLINTSVAKIYEKLSGNYYAKHTLVYQRLDYSDFVSGDFSGGKVVRYAGCVLSTYDPNNSTFADSTTFITTLESEFVLNTGYWSGGYHGNEDFTNVFFMINERPYNSNGQMDFPALPLTACNSFSYIMSSKLKLHSDKSELCERLKIVDFVNGGYKVRTKLKGLQSSTALLYSGICCVAKHFDKIISDKGYSYNATGSDTYLINGDNMVRELIYSSTSYSLKISSTIIQDENNDKLGSVLLWDRANDTKYYRRLSSYPITIGGTLEFEQTVSIGKTS